MEPASDARSLWVEERVMGLFKMSKPDKYRKMASGEETGAPLLKFFDSEDCSAIYFLDGAKDMSCFSAPPTSNKKKLLCMLKPQPARYTKPDEMANIIIFDLSPKLLESMHALMEGVFLPIMSNPENQQAARPSAPPPPELFLMIEIEERVEERTPYVAFFLQECERMNLLVFEMGRSLRELDAGLRGDLSISQPMEDLMNALFENRVPSTWEALAWPSLAPLSPWLADFLDRQRQLVEWTADLNTPKVTWISGLFNPQAFLTAVMQVTARKNEWPLDRVVTTVDVTKRGPEEIEGAVREGAYIYGMYMDGARWDVNSGVIEDANMKELYPKLPVMLVKAVPVEKADSRDQYACPVYKTQFRGPTYVFTAGLKTKKPPSKWVMAGVSLLMSVVE